MLALRSALSARAAVAPALRPRAAVAAPSMRAFSASVRRMADDHHGPPIIQGEGSKSGEVPTNISQATGVERFELLGRMQGIDVWDMKVRTASSSAYTRRACSPRTFAPPAPRRFPSRYHQGPHCRRLVVSAAMRSVSSPLRPIKLTSLPPPTNRYPERVIGCTGSPADSHDTVWISLNTDLKHHRCPECGSGEQQRRRRGRSGPAELTIPPRSPQCIRSTSLLPPRATDRATTRRPRRQAW